AGAAGNWDMAHYKILEMVEMHRPGETTRPVPYTALFRSESSFLDPLDKAIEAKDKTQFEAAYNAAIQGCNSCHGSQTSADFPQGFKFVKVVVPRDTLESIYSYAP